MNLLKCLLTNNECYKTKRTIKPQGVMVHSTGANNPMIRRYVEAEPGQENYLKLMELLGDNIYDNDWNHTTRQVCVHAFIGKLADGTVGSVQTLPWNHRGWHSGSGRQGSANDTHISFEICEDSLTDKVYFDKVYAEAVALTAMLCKEYKLDPMADGVVICHSEGYERGIASNHGDVMHWFPKHGKSMDTFRADVAKAMGVKNPSPAPYKVRVTLSALNIRKGPSATTPLMGVIRDKGVYTIVETTNGWGRLKSGAGWINLYYTKKV